ncbi:MAG: phosphoribosylglycinamide formyltransferase [Cocleimonas sp.]
MYKIVVLISGGGSNLQAIIDSIQVGNIKAEITAVISNRADAFGLERAEKASIDNHVLDHTVFNSRESFDESLSQIIDSYEPDLIVLAGFMRILSDEFVEHFHGKMINIHPSLLPKYKGLNTHQRALDGGDKEHGASVHFVIPELDAGTVIIQGVVPVEANDTANRLQQRVHKVEHQIYPQAVKYLAEDGLVLEDGKLLYKSQSLEKPFIETLK